jgi:hypothetical protein
VRLEDHLRHVETPSEAHQPGMCEAAISAARKVLIAMPTRLPYAARPKTVLSMQQPDFRYPRPLEVALERMKERR